jgi:hypothetical protein
MLMAAGGCEIVVVAIAVKAYVHDGGGELLGVVMRWIAVVLCLLFASRAAAQGNAIELRTIAEQTQFVRTGRYAEVEQLCAAFARAYPKQVRCFEFARTPEGRPMLALAASADGKLDPAAVKSAGRPVLLAQGGIRAGEIDGKDAGFLVLRELLEAKAARGVLQQLTFVFVPVFNVDRAESDRAAPHGAGDSDVPRHQSNSCVDDQRRPQHAHARRQLEG